MMNINSIATRLWELDESKIAKCNSAHKICLNCKICHIKTGEVKFHIPSNGKNIAKFIDHTLLNSDAKAADIIKICHEARKYNFASVCLNPYYVKLAKKEMNQKTVCSVVGFPLGANSVHIKIEECKKALKDGATEIDMVQNIGELKVGGYNFVLTEIETIAEICHENNSILKVIIETCLLSKEEKIIACLIAKKAGADFVKTSTGFSQSGATTEDVKLMKSVVGDFVGVKASGGIRDFQKAQDMISAGANRIGASSSLKIIGEK